MKKYFKVVLFMFFLFFVASCSRQSKTEEHIHTWDKGSVTENATCQKRGVLTYNCSGCNEKKTDFIEKLEHTIVVDEAVLPTCVSDGLTEGSHCSLCMEILIPQEKISALGHTTVIDAEIKATCSKEGLTEGSHCLVCNEVIIAQEAIKALGHDIVNHPGKAATCSEDGYKDYETCNRCDLNTYEVIAKFGHTEEVLEGKAATCTEKGLSDGLFCRYCEEVLIIQEEISALGHDLTLHNAKNATCTLNGYRSYEECSRCDYTTYEEILALGHSIIIDEKIDPTCTESGLTEGSHCSVCKEVMIKQEEIPAIGHNIISYDALSPTCEEDGHSSYEACDRCDYTTYKKIPALGHEEVKDPAIDATCTETGLTEGSHCYICKKTLIVQEEIQALGHEFDFTDFSYKDSFGHANECINCDAINEIKAHISSGEASEDFAEICTECNYIITPATGHTTHTPKDEWKSDETHHWNECVGCNLEKINYAEHNWDDGTITLEATCDTNGITLYTCLDCNKTKTEMITSLGHDEVIDEAVSPTCTLEGLTEGSHCLRCEIVLVRQTIIEALGHSYDDGTVTKEATCTKEGILTIKCIDCGEEYEEIIEIIPHQYSSNYFYDEESHWNECECGEKENIIKHILEEEITKNPTATEEGIIKYSCTSCEYSYTESIPNLSEGLLGEIVFKGYSVSYDGKSHNVYVLNLPKEFEVSYEGNGVTEIGEHIIVAKIYYNDTLVKELTAVINIVKPSDVELPLV